MVFFVISNLFKQKLSTEQNSKEERPMALNNYAQLSAAVMNIRNAYKR